MNKKRSANTSARLLKWVERFRNIPILVVGDLMVDRSYRGSADRISPEAPVPVVHVKEDWWTPGGAGNVVNQLLALGARPSLVSIRGADGVGGDLQGFMAKAGVGTDGLLTDPSRPTIAKTRLFVGHQQVARFDFERRGDLSDEVHARLIAAVRAAVPHQRAVVISDYGKGVITPAVIRTCLREARQRGIPVIVDPKIEHFMQYKGVDCITPNTKEAVEGMRATAPKTEAELVRLGEKILSKLRSRSVLITRGEKGMTLFERGRAPDTIPALAQEVYDVTGAGDTVISTFTLARAVGAPFADAARISNVAASIVVSRVGTAVATRGELEERLGDL